MPQQPPSDKRSSGEMPFLYGTSILYGVGTGIWLDALVKLSDPGPAILAPLVLGAAAPIGVYFWDDYDALHRGVPASISTGLVLGAIEGLAITGTQWQHTGNGGPNSWSFRTETSVTWIFASGGGVGGYVFGEWLRPDPRSLSFIASTSAWGALSGTMFGAGVGSGDWKDGASIAGLIGYNAGVAAGGGLSAIGYVPSYRAQQYMWLGYLAGTVATSLVYLFYIGSDSDARHGLIANAAGGLAGVGLAGALAWNVTDDDGKSNQRGAAPMPFQLALMPAPALPGTTTMSHGATVNAFGAF